MKTLLPASTAMSVGTLGPGGPACAALASDTALAAPATIATATRRLIPERFMTILLRASTPCRHQTGPYGRCLPTGFPRTGSRRRNRRAPGRSAAQDVE